MNVKRETKNLKPVLSIIIVNWNTKQLLKTAIQSVMQYTKTPCELIVVDNGSTDGSQQMLQNEFAHVHLIQNQQNLGFTQANNQGIQQSKGDYILLLNSDTKLTQPALDHMIDYLQQHPNIGILGPQLHNQDDTLQPSAGNLPSLMGIFANQCLPLHIIPYSYKLFPILKVAAPSYYQHVKPVGWVSGACFLMRRQVIDAVGPLDSNIFMYVEETELCKRAADADFATYYFPDTFIYHLEGASSKNGKKGPILGVYKGLYYYFHKHKPAWQLPILAILLRTGAILRMPLNYDTYLAAFKINPRAPFETN